MENQEQAITEAKKQGARELAEWIKEQNEGSELDYYVINPEVLEKKLKELEHD